MNRHLVKRCLVWLLPLIVARAFVPAGFMLSAGQDGLALTFCPGDSAALVQTLAQVGEQAAHADHSGADPHATHHSGKHFESPCPFGIAAVALTADAPVALLATLLPTDPRSVSPPTPVTSVGPLRADRIRGPPSLS